MNSYPDTALVYLARYQSGLASFWHFIEAYQAASPGIDHDLIVAFKGFPSSRTVAGWRASVNGLAKRFIAMDDFGRDVRAYHVASRLLVHRYISFLNSNSEPLVEGWLRAMRGCMDDPSVGAAGCTGSWASIASVVELLYRREVKPLRRLRMLLKVMINRWGYHPFPNPHLRTNGFITERTLMLRLWPRFVSCRRNAFLWESGRQGFTHRLAEFGKRVVMVERTGSYDPYRWGRCRVFCQGHQEDLLVADNRTRRYALADEVDRQFLHSVNWEAL